MIYSNAILRNNIPVGIRGIMIDMTDRKKAEAQIQKDLKEKEVLLKEIHHRVKNNLQIISSLLGLQARYIQDEKFLNIFKECQNRVRSMALVHEKLYQARDLAIIDFQEYVDFLIRGLYRSYGVSPEHIPYKIHVEDITIAIDLAVPCGLIINELVSNALKYAFPESFQEKGKIDIKLHQIDEKEVELVVRDNGIGLPKNIDLKKTKTLGLQLVSLLAESQLAGTAACDRKKGTRFQIRFPI
jgi:two-component sensor histidine kinase